MQKLLEHQSIDRPYSNLSASNLEINCYWSREDLNDNFADKLDVGSKYITWSRITTFNSISYVDFSKWLAREFVKSFR